MRRRPRRAQAGDPAALPAAARSQAVDEGARSGLLGLQTKTIRAGGTSSRACTSVTCAPTARAARAYSPKVGPTTTTRSPGSQSRQGDEPQQLGRAVAEPDVLWRHTSLLRQPVAQRGFVVARVARPIRSWMARRTLGAGPSGLVLTLKSSAWARVRPNCASSAAATEPWTTGWRSSTCGRTSAGVGCWTRWFRTRSPAAL